jgi:phosphoribosyl-ATP pyrophosphohydrolase
VKDKIIREIYLVLEDRIKNPVDSYSSKLMIDDNKSAEDKILEKIGEEAAELIIASKNNYNVIPETADLIFHTLILLVFKGIDIDELFDEFKRRKG